MSFETTYESFLTRLRAQHPEEEAIDIATSYGHIFARDARRMAEQEAPADAATLRRLADQMDPDLRSTP